MPLLDGWGTASRTLLLHLVLAIDGQLAKDRLDRVPSNPELLRARVDMLAYLKRGTTSSSGSEVVGTQTVQKTGPFVMLSVKATSASLGISESLVTRYLREGPLIGIKVNGAWQVDRESVEQRRRQKEREL